MSYLRFATPSDSAVAAPVIRDRRILNINPVRRSFTDPLGGIVAPEIIEVELDNHDGIYNGLDLRGERVTLDTADLISNEVTNGPAGIVVAQRTTLGSVVLTVTPYDLDQFQRLFPRRTVSTAIFPKAHPSHGLGRAIPLIFGNAVHVPLPYVGDDTTANLYDYLVGEGTPTVVKVYRNTVGESLTTIPTAEYTINDAAYPGFRVVRFTTRQVQATGGGLHILYADLGSSATFRNPARAIQQILTDSTFGLGLSMDSASADQAATDIPSGLVIDGALTVQRPALEWLNLLLILRGMRLNRNASNVWQLAVDTKQTHIRAQFGVDRSTFQNVTAVDELSLVPLDETMGSLVVAYRQARTGNYLLKVSRTVNNLSTRERVIEHPLLRDSTAADIVVDYLAKRLRFGESRLKITVGQEGRKLDLNDLIRYEAPNIGVRKVYRITELARTIETTDLEAEGWDASIYSYSAGTLPPEPITEV